MQLNAAQTRAVWKLLRANIAAGGHLRVVAEGVVDTIVPPSPPLEHGKPQSVFWGVDAPGLPPRPWRILPDDVFDCVTLDCKGVAARVCVARQIATDCQRTQQTSRGQGTDYPHCDTRKCQQGRGIREALDPNADVTWKGAGPGGRFDRGRDGKAAQEAARRRKARVGLLDEVRTLDIDPDPAGDKG